MFPSKHEGKPARRSVTVQAPGGDVAECWFDVGSDLEFLRKGDRVFFSLKANAGGKPTATIHLTEELADVLCQRQRIGAADVPAERVQGTLNCVSPNGKADHWSQEKRIAIAAEIRQRGAILGYCEALCREQFPDATEQTRSQYAITLYNDVKELWQ
jgi:hypothetical protein